MGITELPPGAERLTGDLLVDVLGGIAAVVARWCAAAERVQLVHLNLGDASTTADERRSNMVLELRRREKGGAS